MLGKEKNMSTSIPQYHLNETDIKPLRHHLIELSAQQRIEYVLHNLTGPYALTSSFGAQSAVSLHMLTQLQKDIPVILIDTGYLFPETYQFIDELSERLKLNLKVYKSALSPAWLESRYGQLWSQGVKGIDKFNNIMKVAPLNQALEELNINVWFSGIRSHQSASRKNKPVIELKKNSERPIIKVHPIIDWSDRDIYLYLKKHNLPYHPLWDKGYVSIGDVQTSHPLSAGMSIEDTRFFGLKRECGIHE